MSTLLTKNLKVKFLGITPVLEDKTGFLNPQEIVSLSALLTFKGKNIKRLLDDSRKKEESLQDKIKLILQKSALRGHASIATTPSLCLTYEGSKFLDWALTGLVFSSSLVSSGRRTDTTNEDIVYPEAVIKNKKVKKIYECVSKNNIETHNFFISKGISKDEARKVLQQGIYGTGVIQLPIESIVLIKREFESEKEWMPEEIGFLLRKIEKETKDLGIDLLYASREIAPRNIYPYPNVFKNPNRSNMARELMEKEKLQGETKIISIDFTKNQGLKDEIYGLIKKRQKTFKSFGQIKKEWFNILTRYQKILRDYNTSLRFKVLSSVPMGLWTEKKRHRTVPQTVESIYFCTDRAVRKFNRFKNQIKQNKITKKIIREIEEVFSLPPSIKNNPDFLNRYLLSVLNSFSAYRSLIRLGIRPKDAILLIPRGLKIDVLQEYDLFNLISGYYPQRLCATADEEMRRNTIKEANQIKKILKEKEFGWLNGLVAAKCNSLGFCPEEKSCGMVLSAVKNYNEKFHQEMKKELKNKFQENLKKLGK